MDRYGVIVVGAGPAGASTAHALASKGVEVLLLDRAQFPRPKPCAEFLSPQCARRLHDMGALEAVEGCGAARLTGMRVRAPSGDVICGSYHASARHRPFREYGFSIRREVLDAILVERTRVAGVRVMEQTRLVDLARNNAGRVTGVVVTDTAGRRRIESARLVVGADGLHSVVARRLRLARTGRWPRRLALVAHYRGVGGIGEDGELHVQRDGFVGIADVGAGLTTVALVVPARQAPEIAGDCVGFLERWMMAHPHLATRFRNAQRASPVRATGPFASHARRSWAPGAALVGDAADFFDPFTGQGIHSALRGGELLAGYALRALAAPSDAAGDRLLRCYERARRLEFGGKWMVERAIGAVVGNSGLMNRAARVLSRRRDLANLLIGVTGDFIPAREVLRLAFLVRVFLGRTGAQ